MNPCQETSGFLFPHPCGQPRVLPCVQCMRFVCMQHARLQQMEQYLCVTCARAAAASDGGGVDRDDAWDSDEDDDDPYFYSSRYRALSGTQEPDPMDFTAGDQAAFDKDEGGGGSFEDDMGAS
jgi:hypothetical protein